MADFEPTAPQETWFFRKSVGSHQEFWQKPGFSATSTELTHCASETGFFPKSGILTKNFGKKTRFLGHVHKSQIANPKSQID